MDMDESLKEGETVTYIKNRRSVSSTAWQRTAEPNQAQGPGVLCYAKSFVSIALLSMNYFPETVQMTSRDPQRVLKITTLATPLTEVLTALVRISLTF